MTNKPVVGYLVGQAANLAHEYLTSFGEKPSNPEEAQEFLDRFWTRTEFYIGVLNQMQNKYGKEGWRPYVAPKDIPVIVDIEDKSPTNK